ncbi:MAG: hypothetical protein OEU26_23500 [Candidatus Tectomicrobia bacterium]|nr:hypothetical protein [Candidatus Tectomicrobia bacterium]
MSTHVWLKQDEQKILRTKRVATDKTQWDAIVESARKSLHVRTHIRAGLGVK